MGLSAAVLKAGGESGRIPSGFRWSTGVRRFRLMIGDAQQCVGALTGSVITNPAGGESHVSAMQYGRCTADLTFVAPVILSAVQARRRRCRGWDGRRVHHWCGVNTTTRFYGVECSRSAGRWSSAGPAVSTRGLLRARTCRAPQGSGIDVSGWYPLRIGQGPGHLRPEMPPRPGQPDVHGGHRIPVGVCAGGMTAVAVAAAPGRGGRRTAKMSALPRGSAMVAAAGGCGPVVLLVRAVRRVLPPAVGRRPPRDGGWPVRRRITVDADHGVDRTASAAHRVVRLS